MDCAVFDVAGVKFVDEAFPFRRDDEDDQLVEQVGDNRSDLRPFLVVDADGGTVDYEGDIYRGVFEEGGEVSVSDGQALAF